MVSTIKFSQFQDANLVDDNNVVGLGSALNTKSEKFVSWSISSRPISPINPVLGFNTDLNSYEYWSPISAQWVQLESSYSDINWNNITGTSQIMSPNNGYVANNTSLVTLTLPVLCAFGQRFYISGLGSGGWTINLNAMQQLIYGNTSASIGIGTLSSSNLYDQCEILCVETNRTFIVRNSQGNLIIT